MKTKVDRLKFFIREKMKEINSDGVALCVPFLLADEEKELSRWYKITKEPLGYIFFEKIPGILDDDNGQLRLC